MGTRYGFVSLIHTTVEDIWLVSCAVPLSIGLAHSTKLSTAPVHRYKTNVFMYTALFKSNLIGSLKLDQDPASQA